MDEWLVPIAHIPKPYAKQKQRIGTRFYRIIVATLFQIATLGLFVIFLIFKGLLFIADWVWGVYKSLAAHLETAVKKQYKKRVIVVGGGYAGLHAAKTLEDAFDVTLIDTKEYFEFTPSRLRILVEPSHAYRVQLKHTDILKKTNIVAQPVHYVTADGVETSTQWIPYDYLIITTGSRYREPSFPPIADTTIDSDRNARILSARVEHIERYHDLLNNSRRILVIGAGTVGTELVGEIADKYDDKEITLIHAQSKLMPRSTPRAIRYTEQFFKDHNVRLVLGERIVEQSGLYFKTDHGTIIEADLAFVCTGNIPNSELLKFNFPNHINTYGFVKVNEHMQLAGYSNIFVAGDLTDIPNQEEKLCQTAYHEIKVVVENIFNIELSKPLSKYIPSSCPMLISLGKYHGIFTYKGWSFTGFIPAVMKEFVEWKEMVFYWNVKDHFNFRKYISTHSKSYLDKGHLEEWSKGHAHII